ncbi:serine protease SP24D-like [Musca vetustissima]|uniref:serine protease SP24D-like n=1 Tax=Musca vetustissima TaxID=27455 RepID=UPI002AB741DF|nr:serine protease SP24D-like [Musca vetustissima]
MEEIYFCSSSHITVENATNVQPFHPEGRIVGGAVARDGQFPYQVSVRWGGAHVCGGSIISETFVVTAAHCLTMGTPEQNVRAGSRFIFYGGQVRQAAETYVHADYKDFDNDIGLIQLSEPLLFNTRVNAVPLATHEPPSGVPVVTSGWGRTSSNGTVVNALRYNTLMALTSLDCSRRLPAIPESVICLAHSQGNGVCDGDSGGPAVYNGELVGVTNYMVRSCGTTNPDAYASVAFFRNWLQERIRGGNLVKTISDLYNKMAEF